MTVKISAEPSAVQVDEGGTIRIGTTRVTLSTLVAAFSRGATAEQIAQDYPALALPDVYAAIAYYLRHQPELDAYLAERGQNAAAFRRQSDLYAAGVRERLLARSKATRAD